MIIFKKVFKYNYIKFYNSIIEQYNKIFIGEKGIVKRFYSPFRYPGGKGKLFNYVNYLMDINGFENDSIYIEPFSGGAGISLSLLMNNCVDKIVINDYDKSIYSVWFNILNRPKQLISMIENVDINIDEWHKQKELHLEYKNYQNSIENAFSTLFLNRTNVSGIITGGPIGGKKQIGKYKIGCRFNKKNIIKTIEIISSNKKKIDLYRCDAQKFIDNQLYNYPNDKTFIFFDPPYYKQGKNLYFSFYKDHDHKKLSEKINSLNEYKWILTYDVDPFIYNCYKDNIIYKYNIGYSANVVRSEEEYLITNNNVKINSKYNVEIMQCGKEDNY